LDKQADETHDPIRELLSSEPIVIINLGLERFAETLTKQGIPFVHVDWRPPAGGDHDLTDMLAALKGK
jgi:FdrA protein